MKTITFAFKDTASSTLLFAGILSNFTYEGYNFIRVPVCENSVADINFNEGYSKVGFIGESIFGNKAFISFPRFSKNYYNDLLNNVAKKLRCKDYKELKYWEKSLHCTPVKGKSYLVRPNFGARGIGFIKLNTEEFSINAVVDIVSLFNNKNITEEVMLSELKRLKANIVDSKRCNDTWEDFFGSGVSVTEFIPNIVSEYRILTNHKGVPSVFVKREIRETIKGFNQATGASISLLNASYDSVKTIGSNDIIKNALKVITATKMPIHSFDLFLTSDNKFGFFEASSQFGCTTIPSGWVHEESKRFFAAIAKKLT